MTWSMSLWPYHIKQSSSAHSLPNVGKSSVGESRKSLIGSFVFKISHKWCRWWLVRWRRRYRFGFFLVWMINRMITCWWYRDILYIQKWFWGEKTFKRGRLSLSTWIDIVFRLIWTKNLFFYIKIRCAVSFKEVS